MIHMINQYFIHRLVDVCLHGYHTAFDFKPSRSWDVGYSNERYDKFEEMCLQSIKPHFWRF